MMLLSCHAEHGLSGAWWCLNCMQASMRPPPELDTRGSNPRIITVLLSSCHSSCLAARMLGNGSQAAAMTAAEQCNDVAGVATTSVKLSIAMAGQATGRTVLPGPECATLGACLEDWCLSKGLCQDALTVYHLHKALWKGTSPQACTRWGTLRARQGTIIGR